MRAHFFRWLLHRWKDDTPEIVRRIQLQILMNLTVKAFLLPGKRLWPHPWRDGLREYAEYTHRHCENADPQRLYALSFALGKRLRRVTGFHDAGDLRRLVFWLYGGIGITMDGKLPGEVAVSGCFFSDYYVPSVCALMSHMDSGIVGGIMGGGRLFFTERITEGRPCCIARLRSEVQYEGR